MSLERRLQHAARELRELAIEPPGRPVSPVRRQRPLAALTAVGVPVLFVLSGVLVAAGAFARVAPSTTLPAAAAVDEQPPEPGGRAPHTTTTPTPAHVEVGLIADLVRAHATPVASPPPVTGTPISVPGPVSLV